MKKFLIIFLVTMFVFILCNPIINAMGDQEDTDLTSGACDVNGWGWKEYYGSYIVDNPYGNGLLLWYDIEEKTYSFSHPYSSLSCVFIPNGTFIRPVNELCISDSGNEYAPVVIDGVDNPYIMECNFAAILWLPVRFMTLIIEE